MRFPRWVAPISWGVAFLLFHAGLPWSLSRYGANYGWSASRSALLNLVGIIAVAAGFAVIAWSLALHFVSAKQGWRVELTPRYLLTRGPFRFTRNPMYVAAIAIWSGWALLFGSPLVLVALTVIWMAAVFVLVPWEERRLEQRFGDAYREYCRTVPRWVGRN